MNFRYRVFKVIDENNIGEITNDALEYFINNIYNNLAIEFKKSDMDAVYVKIDKFWEDTKSATINFDSFLVIVEKWFIQWGAFKFVTDKDLRVLNSMTDSMWRGFHKIIKAFFINNFMVTSQLIEEGKELYQDLENSILDMNISGKFEQFTMEEKSDSLEQSKIMQLSSFKVIIEELRPTENLSNIKDGLDNIIKIFEFLNKIVIDHELREIVQDVSGVFQLIIWTDLTSRLSDLLELGDSEVVYLIKISALKILCYLSMGLTFFNTNDDK